MAYIKAISYYLPGKELSNKDLLKDFPDWTGEKVLNKVGVQSRHLAAQDETAGDMAEKAARRLFDEYGIDPKDIDFILLCTTQPDYIMPHTAALLQDRLGIPTTAGALDYNLGCSGCIYGMALAKGLIAGGIARNVLLLTSETFSKILHPSDVSNRTIFGDGAAACLISTDGIAEIGEFVLGTDGSGAGKLIVRNGASRHPGHTGRQYTDEDGHTHYDDYVYMDGSGIYYFTIDSVPPLVEDILRKNGKTLDQTDYFIFHQANQYMLNTLRRSCGIPKDKFHADLTNTGNTVSSTVLIALRQCLDKGTIQQGMNVLITGFGVGLSWGGTTLRF